MMSIGSGQSIQICCAALKDMIEDGAIALFTTEAGRQDIYQLEERIIGL